MTCGRNNSPCLNSSEDKSSYGQVLMNPEVAILSGGK